MLVKMRALRREVIAVGGRQVPTTVLSINSLGTEMLSWINSNGQVVRQESPLGVLELSTAEECLRLVLDDAIQPDLLRATAVPCVGEIPDPRQTRELRLRLTGVSFSEDELSSRRQAVESLSKEEAVLVLTSESLPADDSSEPLSDDALESALASSPFVQSEDPAMIKRAQEIVAGETDPGRMAHALSKWVDRNVENTPSVGLPSALQVLEELRGDCNEHTYLYVALARALKLPAKIKVGLVYHKGAFYYHAWPAVYIGEWVEIDPTLNQYTVDATHIALIEGELKDQLKLARIFGKLKIEVLDIGATGASPEIGDS